MVLCLQLILQSQSEFAPAKMTLVLAAALSAQLASLQTSATWMTAVLAHRANKVGSMQTPKDALGTARIAHAQVAKTARGRKNLVLTIQTMTAKSARWELNRMSQLVTEHALASLISAEPTDLVNAAPARVFVASNAKQTLVCSSKGSSGSFQRKQKRSSTFNSQQICSSLLITTDKCRSSMAPTHQRTRAQRLAIASE